MRRSIGILFVLLFNSAAASPMIEIPAGIFYRGSSPKERYYGKTLCMQEELGCEDTRFKHEGPARWIYLSSYLIEQMEVSQLEYQGCVDAGACQEPQELGQRRGDDLPVVGVTWEGAKAYCTFIGGRLPTEAEWEKAARGKDGRLFPWGDVLRLGWVNHGQGGPPEVDSSDGFLMLAPVNSMKEGASAFGLLHMAGNVWEWVEDEYSDEAYLAKNQQDPLVAPSGPTGDRVVRGGSYQTPLYTLRAAWRGVMPADKAASDVGFRCAR